MMSRPFCDFLAGDNLDKFHDRCVIPQEFEIATKTAAVGEFIKFLQGQFRSSKYSVAEVLKSGSLGKGTAVRGTADIDLVVIFNNISSIEDLKATRATLLADLKQRVLNSYSPRTAEERVKFEKESKFSLTCVINGEKLDILPAFDVERSYGGLQGVYLRMKQDAGRETVAALEFSASLAKYQIDFVKRKGEPVKRGIRLLKFWKEERKLDIRSYTLELLSIHANNEGYSGAKDVFTFVLKMLQEPQTLKVFFKDNYEGSQYVRGLRAPYVLDPANPYMNTLYRVDMEGVSREATNTLRSL